MTLSKRILGNPRVKKALNRTDKMVDDSPAWLDELVTLHASRSVRSLDTTRLLEDSLSKMLESNIDNQATRSRCVEIQMKAFQRQILLEELVEKLRPYILHKYEKSLKKRYSTVTDRKSYVDLLLNPIIAKSRKLRDVNKMASMVIDDCTHAGWSLKSINDSLTLRNKDRYDKA